MKLFKFLKDLVYPVTPLTVLTLASLLITFYTLIIVLRSPPEAVIYISVVGALTLILVLFYIIERKLVKVFAYYKVVIGEIIIILLTLLFSSFQDRSYFINFKTEKDFILVIFDSKGVSISDFKRNGIFNKELNVNDKNIVHVDSLLLFENNLQINKPADWDNFSGYKSKHIVNNHSINYIIFLKNKPKKISKNHPQTIIDSLLNKVIKE